jgi:hypothetical protein
MSHEELIEEFARGGEKLASAIRGVRRQDLFWKPPEDAPPELGKWSIQQILIHLADSETAFADRIRRVIAEDNPTLMAWDEKRFAANLFYEEQSVDDALTWVAVARRQLARVLRKLPESGFARTGRHTERGVQSVTDVMKYATQHLDHHVKFINAKRAKLATLAR